MTSTAKKLLAIYILIAIILSVYLFIFETQYNDNVKGTAMVACSAGDIAPEWENVGLGTIGASVLMGIIHLSLKLCDWHERKIRQEFINQNTTLVID